MPFFAFRENHGKLFNFKKPFVACINFYQAPHSPRLFPINYFSSFVASFEIFFFPRQVYFYIFRLPDGGNRKVFFLLLFLFRLVHGGRANMSKSAERKSHVRSKMGGEGDGEDESFPLYNFSLIVKKKEVKQNCISSVINPKAKRSFLMRKKRKKKLFQ